MSNAYSFYPYNVSRDIEVSISNLRLDGKSNDHLIRNKKIFLYEKNWSKVEFNVHITTKGYDGLFTPDEKGEITGIVTVDCVRTQFRTSVSEVSEKNKTRFNLEVELNKRDLLGNASIDAFILRNDTQNVDQSEFASTGGQRICVQGEEDYYWSLIVDEPEISGNDIDLEYISFKDDERFNLEPEKDSFYCLRKVTTSRPKLFVNTDFKQILELWDPKSLYSKPMSKREKAFRTLLDKIVGKDVKLQLSINALTEAYSEGEFEDGASEGFKENLVKEWMMRLDPEEESRELFLNRMNDRGYGKLVSNLSSELNKEIVDAKVINKFIRSIK